MNLEVDAERLMLAHKAVRAELLAERAAGHWSGQLASSPFATAAAVSALVTTHRGDSEDALRWLNSGDGPAIEQVVQGDLSELLLESVHWLARQQNPDGGWGDCVEARSNLGATMMVQAAFRLTGIPAKYADLMMQADDYVAAAGGLGGLRRQFPSNKPLLAAILANCALAGMVSWRQVPTLPFELACLPKFWQRGLQVFAPRQATPELLAIGQAKFHHDPPKNPISRLIRRSLRTKSLALLERYQATDDSYLASTPLTAFVVMCLSSMGYQDHAIVRRGIEFLFSSVRADSSWSVTPNLAVFNTALASSSLASQPVAGAASEWSAHDTEHAADDEDNRSFSECCCDWLLSRQRTTSDELTQVRAGGWAASDAPGALPATGATACVLLALASLRRHSPAQQHGRAERAAERGIGWLLELQNEDGGWPTFYRDDTLLRVDESGPDVTSQVLRALAAWRQALPAHFRTEAGRAIERGWKYLESVQRQDGSFIPLWFGNEHQPDDQNPVYGTSQVLLAGADLDRLGSSAAQRAARWLVAAQHSNGGWGPPRSPVDYSAAEKDRHGARRSNEAMAQFCSIEETSLAVSALLPMADSDATIAQAAARGLNWLINAVERDGYRRATIIGFSLAKLWYHERMYPLAFATAALSRALRSISPKTPAATHSS